MKIPLPANKRYRMEKWRDMLINKEEWGGAKEGAEGAGGGREQDVRKQKEEEKDTEATKTKERNKKHPRRSGEVVSSVSLSAKR